MPFGEAVGYVCFSFALGFVVGAGFMERYASRRRAERGKEEGEVMRECQRHTYQAKPITDLSELKRGDLVRNKSGGGSYVVEDRYGGLVIAVRTVLITNPREWEVVRLEDEVTEAAG